MSGLEELLYSYVTERSNSQYILTHTEQAAMQSQYEAMLCTPFQAAARGFVDDIIKPSETRLIICKDLELLATKKQSMPWKKHGNIPL